MRAHEVPARHGMLRRAARVPFALRAAGAGEARDGVKAMIDGLVRGVDFDTMREECEEEIDALGEWTERVQQSRTGWSKQA
jgi:hypothetical protein